jgi:hypothetical protein
LIGIDELCDTAVAGRAITAARAGARDEEWFVLLEYAAVREMMTVAGCEEEDRHFVTVLAAGKDHETAEQNLENKARQGGFSFVISPIDAKGEEA